jgi:uncharacterized protein (DUF885 family)
VDPTFDAGGIHGLEIAADAVDDEWHRSSLQCRIPRQAIGPKIEAGGAADLAQANASRRTEPRECAAQQGRPPNLVRLRSLAKAGREDVLMGLERLDHGPREGTSIGGRRRTTTQGREVQRNPRCATFESKSMDGRHDAQADQIPEPHGLIEVRPQPCPCRQFSQRGFENQGGDGRTCALDIVTLPLDRLRRSHLGLVLRARERVAVTDVQEHPDTVTSGTTRLTSADMRTSDDIRVNDLADRALAHFLDSDPLEATLIGMRDRDARLTDISVEGLADGARERAAIRAAALSIDPELLSPQDAITREVILATVDYADDAEAAEALSYTVAAFPVAPSSIVLTYVRMVVVTSPQQAADYLHRLGAIPHYLEQAEERLRLGFEAGLTPVGHLVEMAVDQIDLFLSSDPCPLAVDAPGEWVGAEVWAADRDRVIDDVVKPAFLRHRDVLESRVLPTGRSLDAVGLVHLPGGRERYRALARVHTTTDRTPEELHQIGLDIVADIHAEFIELGTDLFGLSQVHEIFTHLNTEPSLRWSSSQEILDAAEAAVRRAESAAPDWFGTIPRAICTLDAIPELEEAGAPAAYYMQPALDGSRPGTYYSNVSEPTQRTRFDLESVAYHEAVPGHHFQISRALEAEELPMLRRVSFFFTAYIEGWGLYSERLADEMGLYTSPLQRMGMLSADVWRATRLVVDTGMHAFGWSRERAVQYLLDNTPAARIEVEAEIDRYIAMPGQALAYMTGRLEIQALRKRAEETLGGRFDIKAFHDVVLGSGALPLALLGELVEDWIRSVD